MAGESSDLEFNGPFPDWWNVVDDFGADPTGTMNSTGAFQDMINAMVPGDLKNDTYNGVTGYIPSGTYLIGSLMMPPTCLPTEAIGINLWGQDPATTILKYIGSPGNNMIWMDGCHSSTINRLTFDGQGVADAGVRLERNAAISLQNTYSRLQD
ncbi:MAG: hypothetical protein GEV13_26695 [Rhodospirillales bacterium]|nr:hypothetical protein [Rhodospirillales bacterium]